MRPKHLLAQRTFARIQRRAIAQAQRKQIALILLALLTLLSVLALSMKPMTGNEVYKDRMTESLINKAEALQALGLYPRACNTLLQAFEIAEPDCQKLTQKNDKGKERQKSLLKTLEEQPNSLTKAIGLRGLGDALQKLGDLELSEQVLQLSLKVAEGLPSHQNISAALLSLGNTERAKGIRERGKLDITNEPKYKPLSCINSSNGETKNYKKAAKFYQQAASESTSPTTRIQAQLNHLSIFLDLRQSSEAKKLWQEIQPQIDNLPLNKTKVYAKINFAHSLICLRQFPDVNEPSWQEIDQLLSSSVQEANNLKDKRAESYALGYRGGLYEQIEKQPSNQNLTIAQDFTEQALIIAQSLQAWDIAYLWQWQLGYLLKSQGNIKGAIAAYEASVNALEYIRKDLVALSSDIQYFFRENVEPVYRDLVDLLLAQDKAVASQENIVKARNVIESLRIAELENFLRCSLQNDKLEPIDQPIKDSTAVIYPIILRDRIEVILRLPGNQPLSHYSNPLHKNEIDSIIKTLRATLKNTSNKVPDAVKESQEVYDLLLRKMEAELENNKIKTLVFVLDGSLRNIPMAALHNGKQYLIEKYAVALSPSLQLLSPKLRLGEQLEILAAGIFKQIPDSKEEVLTKVKDELEKISKLPKSLVLTNEQFTRSGLQNKINSRPFSVVHLATHGKFSSSAEETYIRAWNNPININQLSQLIQTREKTRPEPIELLTLSACETAEGNKRSALGMAGVAIRSGARSTLATLWQVPDNSTAELMENFYKTLLDKPKITKAEALQLAQQDLLRKYKLPFNWSPYVLIGNWL